MILKNMPTKDTGHVLAFLSEFVQLLTAKFPEEIDFILLFGSAARGEFRAGISDVDLIIQVKHEAAIAKVEGHAEATLWKLDKKHKTRLREVCSTMKTDILGGLEKGAKLYKPFEVLGPGDVIWSEGRLASPALGPFSLMAPISQFAKKIKKEGKILYGRNILKEINVHDSIFDRLKGIFVPYVLSIFAAPLSLVMPNRALGYSIKAVLYSIDAQLAAIETRSTRITSLNMKILGSELGTFCSMRLAKEALQAKKNFDKTKGDWSYIDKVAFCFQAPVYIFYNNLLSFFRLKN